MGRGPQEFKNLIYKEDNLQPAHKLKRVLIRVSKRFSIVFRGVNPEGFSLCNKGFSVKRFFKGFTTRAVYGRQTVM